MRNGDEKTPVSLGTATKRKWTWHCVGYDEAGNILVDMPTRLSRTLGLDLIGTAGGSPLDLDYNVKEGELRLCGGDFYVDFTNLPLEKINKLEFLKRMIISNYMYHFDVEIERVLSIATDAVLIADPRMPEPPEDTQTSVWIRYKTGISKSLQNRKDERGLIFRDIEQREEDRGLGGSDVLPQE